MTTNEPTTPRDVAFQEACGWIGRFMLNWNLMELELAAAIRQLCKLSNNPAGAVIVANMPFQAKMSTLVTLVNLLSRKKPDAWKEETEELFRRLYSINAQWRNLVAHNAFTPLEDGSLQFLKVDAKKELRFPKPVKTRAEFQSVCAELNDLSSRIEAAVAEITRETPSKDFLDALVRALVGSGDTSVPAGLFNLSPTEQTPFEPLPTPKP